MKEMSYPVPVGELHASPVAVGRWHMFSATWIAIVMAALLTGASAIAQTSDVKKPLARIPAMPLPAGVEIEFSSAGVDLCGRIADLIGLAQKEVLVSQYAITDVRVLQALKAAYQRGAMVAVLLDRSPAIKNYDTPHYLRGQGIPVVAARRGIDGHGWHNQRYIVIDREAVILSSCDLTNSAQKNNENMIVLHLPAIAVSYYNEWLLEGAAGQPLP